MIVAVYVRTRHTVMICVGYCTRKEIVVGGATLFAADPHVPRGTDARVRPISGWTTSGAVEARVTAADVAN